MSNFLRQDRPWSEYPLGTRAHAATGGYWIKVPIGWKWHCGSTFPTPGGDACGCCVELPMNESQTPRTDALKAQGIEWVPIGRMKDVESELAATRARLVELEGIAERLYETLRDEVDINGFFYINEAKSTMRTYELYKEGKK